MPAGNYNGNYNNFGNNANFWSSTQVGADKAWCRRLRSTGPIVDSGADFKAYGYSVRCVRD